MDYQKTIIVGRLGACPELKSTSTNKSMTRFHVATTDSWTDRDGQRNEKTEWHSVVIFNELAERCAKYLQKGQSVLVEGKLQTRSWDDNQGVKRYSTDVIAHKVVFGEKSQGSSDPSFNSNDEIPF